MIRRRLVFSTVWSEWSPYEIGLIEVLEKLKVQKEEPKSIIL